MYSPLAMTYSRFFFLNVKTRSNDESSNSLRVQPRSQGFSLSLQLKKGKALGKRLFESARESMRICEC